MITRRQRGVSTITALFLITVMVSVGVAGAALFRTTQMAQTLELQATRADQAAEAAMEWATWNIVRPAGGAVCVGSANLANLPGTLQPFVVTITCQASGPYSEGGPNIRTYRLRAVACNQPLPPGVPARCPNPVPGDGYVERDSIRIAER